MTERKRTLFTTEYGDPSGITYALGTAVVVAIFLGLVAAGFLFTGWFNTGFMPQRRLDRATIEKRILVEEARARADSAVEDARAEVARARGVAESNEIIAGSIDEQYLRYLFITGISDKNNEQIIYVPTEANLPILEAGQRKPLP
jgi:hypothetical protein